MIEQLVQRIVAALNANGPTVIAYYRDIGVPSGLPVYTSAQLSFPSSANVHSWARPLDSLQSYPAIVVRPVQSVEAQPYVSSSALIADYEHTIDVDVATAHQVPETATRMCHRLTDCARRILMANVHGAAAGTNTGEPYNVALGGVSWADAEPLENGSCRMSATITVRYTTRVNHTFTDL